MDSNETKNLGKLHCPECNCMYIIIDNEIAFCPGCALSSLNDTLIITEEERQERVSSILHLNFNRSSQI